MSYKNEYQKLIQELLVRIKDYYAERLISVAIFGSVARGTFRPDSDIDLLIVARDLPRGRRSRLEEFLAHIELPLEETFQKISTEIAPEISPVIKTPEEVKLGSPLFLDMLEEVLILYDREDFLTQYLENLRQKLKCLGAKRVFLGEGWYWVLKPDYRPGEIIKI